jgi:SprT protein
LTSLTIRQILAKYIPEKATDPIAEWIIQYRVKIKISRSRSSKLGDYRSPRDDQGHRITINHDLNPYAFLITLVHEIAHLSAHVKYSKKRIAPHGKEWKNEFKIHLQPFLNDTIFPEDVHHALVKHIENPMATSCSDMHLQRILKKYNDDSLPYTYLEDLPNKSIFQLKNGRCFIKGEKLRKRFRCMEVGTKHIYLISPLSEVILNDPKSS